MYHKPEWLVKQQFMQSCIKNPSGFWVILRITAGYGTAFCKKGLTWSGLKVLWYNQDTAYKWFRRL